MESHREFGLDGVVLMFVHRLIVLLVPLYVHILVAVHLYNRNYLLCVICSLDYV